MRANDKTIPIIGIVILHGLGIGLLALAGGAIPTLAGLAFLAYTLGLRHALDLDHIAAIDNAVRKIGAAGGNASAVGFWFSLGHSTVVFLLALGLGGASAFVATHMEDWKAWGGQIGPTVSGLFLILIGVVNLVLWVQIWGELRGKTRRVGHTHTIPTGGLLGKIFAPLFRFVGKSWHLYPLGFLFGLGFDTASEIALLALSVQSGVSGLSWTGLLALPLLFAAGMSLLDFLDGVFMARAYGWGQTGVGARGWHNLVITGLSVMTALALGGLQLVQILIPLAGWTGAFWSFLEGVDVAEFGWLMVALSALIWGACWMWWKATTKEEKTIARRLIWKKQNWSGSASAVPWVRVKATSSSGSAKPSGTNYPSSS